MRYADYGKGALTPQKDPFFHSRLNTSNSLTYWFFALGLYRECIPLFPTKNQ